MVTEKAFYKREWFPAGGSASRIAR